MDTIFALASAAGKAGVSVIRVSGPKAFAAAAALAGSVPELRRASLRDLRDKSGQPIDNAIVIAFPEKQSFTGEPVVEFQTHGSRAVVASVLGALGKIEGLRLAEPGEFTRRALENGRMDLAQVEGLADLIDAETEAQRRQALRVFSGELGARVEDWRRDLIRAAALLEATIDFADEEVPEDVGPEVSDLLSGVSAQLAREVAGSHVSERLQHGFEVAIVGAPNVGKSTLLNRLAGRKAAITSEIAGTTRDIIEVRMDLDGLPVTFLDTAGLRETDDQIEELGVELALARARQADLRVFLVSDEDTPQLDPRAGDVVVRAKADLDGGVGLAVSGKTGLGVSQLIDLIRTELSDRVAGASLATRARHREAMERAVQSLSHAQDAIDLGSEHTDIVAEEVRAAVRALESVIGRVDVESVLDEIFASFCLGK